MASGEAGDIGAHNSKIAALVDRFMKQVASGTDDEDWQEADGWVGKMVLTDTKGAYVYTYAVKAGKMERSESRGPFVAVVTMSISTFLDLLDAAFNGRADIVFERKYAGRHIKYQGERWIVDSERFSKVFRRLGAAGVRG